MKGEYGACPPCPASRHRKVWELAEKDLVQPISTSEYAQSGLSMEEVKEFYTEVAVELPAPIVPDATQVEEDMFGSMM